jgi:hypothetical protein
VAGSSLCGTELSVAMKGGNFSTNRNPLSFSRMNLLNGVIFCRRYHIPQESKSVFSTVKSHKTAYILLDARVRRFGKPTILHIIIKDA